MQEQGLPDLIICYRGRFVGAEAKQPGEKPSRKQIQILDEIEEAGGKTIVFTTVRDVERLLRMIDQEVDR